MENDIIISQDSNIKDIEIEELRSAVGWDNKTGPFSIIREKLYTYFTARKKDQLIGFIDVLSDGIADAYLQDLAVYPDYQKMGIGTELMKRTIRFLQEKNIKCIQVTFNPELENFLKNSNFIFSARVLSIEIP